MFNILCALDKTSKITPTDALILAAVGILIVFAVLLLLQLIIWLMGAIVDGSTKLQNKHPEWQENYHKFVQKLKFWEKKDKKAKNSDKEDNKDVKLASGSCGDLKLVKTNERDAAMIMAIVADSLETPLNELHFKSIKLVDDNQENVKED